VVWKRASASTTSATLSIGLFPSRARCSRQRRSIIVMSRFFTSKSCLLGWWWYTPGTLMLANCAIDRMLAPW
jgi:hypothetical protein